MTDSIESIGFNAVSYWKNMLLKDVRKKDSSNFSRSSIKKGGLDEYTG